MSLTELHPATVTLHAPVDGPVRWCPPAEPCGDLEVYTAGEPVARVGDEDVLAPGLGFVLRAVARAGTRVATGDPLIEFKVV